MGDSSNQFLEIARVLRGNDNDIRNAYRQILGRESDPGGFNYWKKQLEKGMSVAQMRNHFQNSQEAKNNRKALKDAEESNKANRRAEESGKANIRAEQNEKATHKRKEETGKANTRQEQNNKSNRNVVTSLYRELLNREPDDGGLNHWVKEINDGIKSKSDVANAIRNSAEYKANEKRAEESGKANKHQMNTDIVTSLYRELLNREPDDGGLNHWV